MKNWFSKLLADMNEQGRNIFVIALITFGVSSLSLPLYIYLAIQARSWQLYAMLGMIAAFMLASLYSAALARKNRTDPALAWILGGFYAIVPLLAAVIAGVGLVLAVAQTLGVLLIVRQSLKGPRAARAVMGGIAMAVLTILIDRYAPWERASYPLLSASIPYISGVAILALGIYMLRGYRQYSLRVKLFSAVGFYMLMIIALGVIGFYFTRDLTSRFNDLAKNNLEAAVQLADSQNALWQLRYGFPQFLVLADDAAAREQIVADEPKWYDEINNNMAAYAAGSRSPEEQEALQKWNDVFAKYTGARPRWFELVSAGKLEEAAEWRAQTTTPFGREAVATLNTLIELQREVAAQKESELAAQTATAVVILVGAVIFALTAGLWISSLVVQNLYGPINRLTQVSQQIAGGNFEAQAVIESQDEIGALAGAFNAMSGRLKEAFATISKRAAELQSVAEIATKASQTTRALDLLQTVVEDTKSSYSLYHSHIYLLDEERTKLELTAGAGEPGRQMVSEKRTIALDHQRSLVARAARTNKGAISNDVTREPDFLPNPLLPFTKSEMAIPIAVGDDVLGVLDVQADYINRFTDEDLAIITTLAQQVGTSLQNIRSYERADIALQEAQSLVDNAPEAIIIVDLETGLFANPNENAVKLYGLPREDLVKVGPAQMSPPTQPDGRDSTEKAMEKIGEAMQGGTPIFEWMHRNGQGEDFLCEVRLVRLPGEHPRVRASVTDITERKRSEELTRLRAQQQEALNLITQRIQSATTIESALQVTARELGRALGMKPTLVTLEPDSKNGESQSAS